MFNFVEIMRVNKGLLVSVDYTLEDVDGELIESTKGAAPLEFIYGVGLMLPRFEAELAGMEVGDKFDFVLSPEEAYGDVNPDLKVELPRSAFEVDGEFDSEIVYEGARVPMNTADGQLVEGVVTSVGDEVVKMDFNHDLAGMHLHFIGEVVTVREPSEAEYERYLGHGDCGGGCSGCSGSCGH